MTASIRWGVPVVQDTGVGSAIGDATASAVGAAFADGAGSCIGDATCSAVGETVPSQNDPAAAPRSLLAFWASGAAAPQQVIKDGAGSATGDATVSGVGTALADGAGSATGDATASGQLLDENTATAGYRSLLAFWASGASGGDVSTSPAAFRSLLAYWAGGAAAPQSVVGDGSCIGDATCSGAGDTLFDGAGSAIGDATCSGVVPTTVDGAGSAIGDATCSGVPATNLDGDGSATGDATCEGSIVDATAVVVTPPAADAGGVGEVFHGAWSERLTKPKRKKRLGYLDEMIAELRSRIEEVPVEATAEDIYHRALRVSEALANQPTPSLAAVENQIAVLRDAINEIDDEEAIMLLAV